MTITAEQKLENMVKEKFPKLDHTRMTPQTNIKDLGIDSLDFVEFVYHIESEFDIEIDNESLSRLTTVRDILMLIDPHPEDVSV